MPALSHRIYVPGSGYRERPLIEHLIAVGELAAQFAPDEAMAAFARQAGRWHDLGKYAQAFQDYLHIVTAGAGDPHVGEIAGKVDHATAGAIHAAERYGGAVGKTLAAVIAGHHAGLPDWQAPHGGSQADLSQRLRRTALLAAAKSMGIAADVLGHATLPQPGIRGIEDVHLWVRMLFSCLVDADRLDAEQFARESPRNTTWPTLDALAQRLDRHLNMLRTPSSLAVATARSSVLEQCRDGASRSPGLFSLTVPTGGGKTLSSLAFALDHARQHGLCRVIYVIPYLSIIEQTADVFRAVLGADSLVEHHSSVLPENETQQTQWAMENWDAPLIVTTSVQFFESLFAAHPGTCRKLHRIARSVVILDEAQLISLDYLIPIRAALRSLTTSFGSSILFATATQPAFNSPELQSSAELKKIHLDGVRELIKEPARLYTQLRRVRIEWPPAETPLQWPDLVTQLIEHRQVLCVVSRRQDARDVYQLLPEPGRYHLSALMCAEHRSRIIRQIRSALHNGEMVRLVSTQLIEAGVDVDFPTVFRAFAGLDSIAQAAGRCNRNGHQEQGRVIVFHAPTQTPRGLLEHAAMAARETLRTSVDTDPLSPEAFNRYFPQLYRRRDRHLDRHDVLKRLTDGAAQMEIPFRSVAADVRLIENKDDVSVFVPYGDNAQALQRLARGESSRELLRLLQRYTVNINRTQVEALQQCSNATLTPTGWWILDQAAYDQRLGLMFDNGPDGSAQIA